MADQMNYDRMLAYLQGELSRVQKLRTASGNKQYGRNVDELTKAIAQIQAGSKTQAFSWDNTGLKLTATTPTATLAPQETLVDPFTGRPVNVTPGSPQAVDVQNRIDTQGKAVASSEAQFYSNLITLGFTPDQAKTLAAFAVSEIRGGVSSEQSWIDIQERPEFKSYFPEIDIMRGKGQVALNPAQIISYRKQGAEMLRAAGLPSGFYDQPGDFTNFITGGVSLVELSDRVGLAKNAAYNLPSEVSGILKNAGLGIGDLTAWILDPTVATPLINNRLNQAQDVFAAKQSGINLSLDQAQQAIDNGLTPDQVRANARAAANGSQLFGQLPGLPNDVNATVQDFVVGDPLAQNAVAETAQRRVAAFRGGSSTPVVTNRGATGLGTAR